MGEELFKGSGEKEKSLFSMIHFFDGIRHEPRKLG